MPKFPRRVLKCPTCNSILVFNPMATLKVAWECKTCSTDEFIVEYHQSISGLIKKLNYIGWLKNPK